MKCSAVVVAVIVVVVLFLVGVVVVVVAVIVVVVVFLVGVVAAIDSSKSGFKPAVFNAFDLEMCFAPQRGALFHRSSAQLPPHRPL